MNVVVTNVLVPEPEKRGKVLSLDGQLLCLSNRKGR